MVNARAIGWSVVLVLSFLTVACTTKPSQPVASAPPPQPPGTAEQSTLAPGSVKDFQVNVGDTIHFDFDRSDIRPADMTVLQGQAAWLNKYPSVRVTLEGDCDERGTREYNLALGARRAHAVKDYLMSLNVTAARMETISYGKERPVCAESNEDCWAQNRRAVTVITSSTVSALRSSGQSLQSG